MLLLAVLPLLLTLAVTAFAQHVHYRIPEVEQNAQYMLSRFADWHTYHGPTGTATRATRTGRPHRPPPTPTSTCAYWLEDINHQGLSPFHPDPANYRVFRNVKDFGAKGNERAFLRQATSLSSNLLLQQVMASQMILQPSMMPSAAVADVGPAHANRPPHPLPSSTFQLGRIS